ncbi:MAG: 6-phosphogluconolactonase [Candidatus Diapherotrites archaeon]|uniref:6-phosphogluconolactonase n=1 Tax=Candidatus Iainarchaeum sp. TaxID=3101447 RepID=A0A8T3YM86_9ARCH|nr:6-phosphogluconolactonase [Candidatus Diapherotrites archaeon]
MLKIIHSKDFDGMSRKAAETAAYEINSAKKQFCLAISGGSSVTGLLEELAGRKAVWPAVNAFMADERLVPITDAGSNYRQANELLFSKVRGIHAFPFEMEKGLSAYEARFLSVTNGKLDLVMLGAGEDGHIASLFPNSPAVGNNSAGYIEVHDAPKPPASRISLSPKAIWHAGMVILLFASETKRPAFEKFMDKNVSVANCPAKIALKAKKCIVFTVFGGKNAK